MFVIDGLFSSLLKILTTFVSIYVAVAYSLSVFSGINYSYREPNVLSSNASIVLQPLMEIFADGKVSHWFDWKDIDKKDINLRVNSLSINNSKTQNQNVLDLNGDLQEMVIIEPVSYNNQWSLVYCLKSDKTCKTSNILHIGKVKFGVSKNIELWGKNTEGDFIELKLVQVTNRSGYKEVLYI